ncbi:MAG: flavodoxin family protein [Methanomassiliicoccales archaeon]|nr:MAG: flavodoxin family protein [Methanomassiliicoccales archaeon]
MLVVALNGSPREKGNTEILIETALGAARVIGAETMRLDIAKLRIEGCRECDGCREKGHCVIEDDMAMVYDLIEKADSLIVATPIFFSGPSSQLKKAIDRCQCIWVSGPIRKGRRAAIFAVGADPKANFRNTVSEVRSFLNTIGFRSDFELLVPSVFKKGEINERKEALERAADIGRELASD